ncbi:MAG TPA: hypothetical protein VGC70_13585 [Burkholderiales bacterium]|jgi:hypothetical protein
MKRPILSGFTRNESRTGAACAIAGPSLLFIGTLLHPMQADPNDAVAAFTEYAADHLWIASHLTQLAGVALIVVALLLLADELELSAGRGWAVVASGGALTTLALAIALQAVDGIALKRMVDAWAAAPAAQKDAAFHVAFAVRQIEIGLASTFCITLGITATLYGGALLRVDKMYVKGLGALALLGGVPTSVAGVVIAYSGFSALAMTINMPANFILLVWMLALGVSMWRSRTAPERGC